MQFAWLCSHESYQPEVLVDQAVRAEQAGFDMVTGADHFHPWVDDEAASSFVWSWLGAVAQATDRVDLATSVTCPLFRYHPGLVAQAAATVDRLSGGRFRLGIGAGENINEGPLGYVFPDYRGRMSRMDEAVEILSRLLDGEKVDFAGEHYQTAGAKLYSPPLGRVPVWMAAGGPKSATFAGQRADGLITSVKNVADAQERVVGPYREATRARGREPVVMATRWCVLAGDDEEAWEALRPMRGLRAPGRLEEVDPSVLRQRADDMPRDDILSKFTVARDIGEVVDVYRPLVTGLGAQYVALQVLATDIEEALTAIGQEVLPVLRDL